MTNTGVADDRDFDFNEYEKQSLVIQSNPYNV